MSGPRISVLLPTYNGRDHIEECLISIRAQTFTDFEVVICDDQSSDGTLDVARELAGGDERFRFIQNPRRLGLVENWNNCIAASRGEWVKFVFQDDVIAPTCIEKLLQACMTSGKPFGFCGRDLIFDQSIGDPQRDWLLEHRAMIESRYRDLLVIEPDVAGRTALRSSENPVGEPTATLIRKCAFGQVGLFDPSLVQLCDAEFWFRIMSNLGAAWVPERLATFRVHGKATTAANRRGRAYRAGVLDPLVLQYRFAFDRHFLRLRSWGPPGRTALAMRKELAVRASEVWGEVQALTTSDPSAIGDWKTVSSSCTLLPLLAHIGRVIRGYRCAKGAAKRLIGSQRNGPTV